MARVIPASAKEKRGAIRSCLQRHRRCLNMVGRKLRRHGIALVALVLGMLPLVASTAAADQYFHTSHAELTPIGSAPLQSGFVNDIHANGGTIGAEERYVLNGAMPDTTYSVALHLSFVDPTCTVVNAVRQTST